MKLKSNGDSARAATYHLDPTAAPKTLDLTFEFRQGNKETIQGIYELDGNHLKMCFDSFGEARPTKFPLKAKDHERPHVFGRISVLVLRRIGADPKQDALDQNKAQCARNSGILARIITDHMLNQDGVRRYPPAAI